MKEISSISLTSMANAAHFLFMSNMVDRAEKDSAVAETCAAQVTALRTAVTTEDENLQVSAKSLTTDKIAEADKERDKLYAGYKKAVAGYEGFPDERIAEAAKVLGQHIKDYKINPQMQLDKETGLLVNFIQDLEGTFAPHVAALNLGAFVERLKAANEALRAASDEAYRTFVMHVNAHALIEGDAAYSAFIDYANAEIGHFKQEVLKGTK